MSYYHCGDPYEYEDYGNHGNGDYEYELYSDHDEPDHYKPDHYEPDHTPPDHYDYERDTDPTDYAECENETGAEWETEHEVYGPGGFECEREVEGYEHERLEDERDEVRELEELEYEGHGVHGSQEPEYDDDEMRELEELERMVNEEGYEPQGPFFGYNETQEPPEPAYELENELGYSDDGASEYEDRKDRNGYTYPHHSPPVSATRDDHNPHTPTRHYPTPKYIPYIPFPFPPHTHPLRARLPQLEPTRSRDHVG
jgi:hypothetical protein